MKTLKLNQYNQGVGKYKLLSSTSGVGSIVTTRLGYYVLIADINKWKFIRWANNKIDGIRKNNTDETVIYENSKTEIIGRGLNFIDDKRFIQFLRQEKLLDELVCLVGIPHMALNEAFNTPKWNYHPIKTALQNAGEEYRGMSNHFMINGTHFPKWFKNSRGKLKKIDEWSIIWDKECRKHSQSLNHEHFAPPRDGTHFLRLIWVTNQDGNRVEAREYKTLNQTNLVFICPNGHLSDIPWSKYLHWKTEKLRRIRSEQDYGEDLLLRDGVETCCSNPDLKWTESPTKSEGYGSIYIECLNCELGSGKDNSNPKVNLEGINGLQPYCPGEKPWEMDFENDNRIPHESCHVRGDSDEGRERMTVTLVTANNLYFASGFSSLYIPMYLAENKPPEVITSLELIEKKYNKHFQNSHISREDYWNQKFNIQDFIIENDIKPSDENVFSELLESEFLKEDIQDQNIDFHEHYRWQEYQCFSKNSTLTENEKNEGLSFNDISMPEILTPYFSKIQQVEELKITNVQLDFTRVRPKERIVVDGIPSVTTDGKNIFSINSTELFALPANETLGEGLFFQFEEDAIIDWTHRHEEILESRFAKYFSSSPEPGTQGAGIKRKIFNNGVKHFLVHSFSHIVMRELEFTCGYPTSSLKERLYISSNPEKSMSGVLIYTAEGSEGSMGGLVSQGEPGKIVEIISKSLYRGEKCSSDPLCWESEGQGIFDLNLAACFSCALTSETACEELNLGLDRRVLIDQDFGFFRQLIE